METYRGIAESVIPQHISEEATELTEEDLDILDDRLRGVLDNANLYYQIVMTFNPVSATHWLKPKFFDTPSADVLCHSSTYKENLFVDKQYYDRMERRRIQDPEGYRVYGLGDWGILGGRFFNGWNNKLHVVKPFKIPDTWVRFRCADWGSYRPYAVLWCAVDYDGNLYVYRELYGYGGKPNVGTKESSRVVAQKIATAEASDKRMINYGVLDNACWNRVDTAAPSIAEEINRVLMDNGCMPFNPSTKGREQAAEELRLRLEGYMDESGQQKPALFVFENCFHLIRTLPDLTHDKNRPETYDTNGEDHCLVKGTKVVTERGEVPIEQVAVGDMVLTRNGYRCVEQSALTQKEVPVFKVVLSNGKTITGTSKHPVWVKDKGFVFIKDLAVDDELLGVDELCANLKALCSTESRSEDTPMHQECQIDDITEQTEGCVNTESIICTEKFGNSTTEKSPKDMTFIIRTGTFLTMILKTLKQYPKENINLIIQALLRTKNVLLSWLTSTDTSQKSGTLQKKVENGTPSMAGKLQQSKRNTRLRNNVLSAEKNMKQLEHLHTKANTVQTLVQQEQDERAELTMSSEYVSSAENPSQQTSLGKQNVAAESAVHVVAVINAGNADVYNLTIADLPEYFANGVLVHNCVDALCYGCMSRPYKPEAPRRKDAWELDRWASKPKSPSVWGV